MSTSEHDRLTRPVFFDRQSLGRDDLNCLVEYVRRSGRRHNRHVVGWGVTTGLAVSTVDGAPWRVAVGRGHAVLPSGEEVAVPDGDPPFDVCEAARECLGIPGPCPSPDDLDDPGTPPDDAVRATDFTVLPEGPGPNPLDIGWATVEVRDANGAAATTTVVAFDGVPVLDLGRGAVVRLASPAAAVRLETVFRAGAPVVVVRDADGSELDRQSPLDGTVGPQQMTLAGPGITTVEIEVPDDAGVLRLDVPSVPVGEVFLALCPDETPACFVPGVPPHCRPPGDDIHPSRIREGHRFTVLCALPPGHDRPSCDEIAAMVCGQAHVPPPPDGDCVVIATLSVGTEGVLAVDEFRDRRRLVPQWVLAERARCGCTPVEPQPTPEPTPDPTPDPTVAPSEFSPTPSVPPSAFTLFTPFTPFTPSLFTVFLPSVAPSGIVVPVGPPGPLDFDPGVGDTLSVDLLPGIGPARVGRLQDIGVRTLSEFIGRGSAELADVLDVSEVRVAGLQDVARRRTVEGNR